MKTASTIDRLAHTSEKVSGQLDGLYEKQREAIRNQLELNNGIIASQQNLNSFQQDLSEKFYMLLKILDVYQELKAVIVTCASQIRTVCYHIMAAFAAYVLTISDRTKTARWQLILLWLINLIIELSLPKILLQSNDYRGIDDINLELARYVSYLRSFTVVSGIAIFLHAIYSYKDFAQEANALLMEINERSKNLERNQMLGKLAFVTERAPDYLNE